ncbi:MAG: META domain-containing protein [Anaerolineae bacterium]|jgi:heat shock protein HslJ/uncharacterized protein YraI|nr:META domain-containing protein [Anaerolineae bacterium]
MRKLLPVTFLLLLTLFVAACAPGTLPPPIEQPTLAPEPTLALEPTQAPDVSVPIVSEPVLPGTSWIMATLNGSLPVTETPVTLILAEDGTASGSDGCNRYTTNFVESENTLTFGPIAGTMMACEEPAMSQASEYQQALASVTNFAKSARQLVLFAGDEIVLTFIADVQALDRSLWTVTSFNNGREAVVSLLEGSEITLNFEAAELNGSAGCNNYFGSYTVESNAITVGQLGSTMKFCEAPEGVMDQEQQYLAALQSAATFMIEGNELWLRTAQDAIAVIATKAEIVDLPEPAPSTPTGRVTGASALNIRSGPGTNFPVIGVAREGDEGTIVGKSEDGGWWAFDAPQVPGGVAWASADFIVATNAENVPVIATPPTPVPPPTRVPPTAAPTAVPPTAVPPTAVPTAGPTPQAQINFWADRTQINLGECATLFWDVRNVQAVWVYPRGADFNQFPVTGQGSQTVCPTATTTYELRALLTDGSTQFRQVTINVIQPIATPVPPIIPPATDPLAGTRWQVLNFNNGREAVVTLLPGTDISLDFGTSQANQVSGRAGCNTYFAQYQAGGNTLTVGRPGTTTLACEPEVMTQEQQYLAALQSAATFTIQGNQLEIRSATGALAIVATR